VLFMVPENKRPSIHMPKKWLLILIALIPLFGIGELIRLTLYLGEDFGYWMTFENIVTSFEVGKGWMFLTGISVLLFFMVMFNDIEKERFFSTLSFVLLCGMAVSIGYASHAATLSVIGIFAHILHFLAVTIWPGILLVTGFFSRGKTSFIAFYKWFTPVAMICLLTVIGAGLWLMSYIVPEYVNSYMLDYGQALLIKHVLLLTVVIYSIMNGIWIKKKLLKENTFPVLKWIKAEGIILLFIFVATAVMSQQTPPHDVAQTLQMQEPSKLFSVVTGLQPDANPVLLFHLSLKTFGWLAAAVFFLAAIVLGIKKNKGMTLVLIASLFAAVAFYLMIMSSLSF
jgi:putative copper export protein